MNYAIVTPVWKPVLDKGETENVSFSLDNAGSVAHYFVHPASLDVAHYRRAYPNSDFIALDDRHFKSIPAYSRMMLTNGFYLPFRGHEGIVICQTDAVMLSALPGHVANFDYLGAPWRRPFRLNRARVEGRRRLGWVLATMGVGQLAHVGNGGLSWRRIQPFCSVEQLLVRAGVRRPSINEDLIVAYLGARGLLRIPAADVARAVFMEEDAAGLTDIPAVAGFHALDKFNPLLRAKLMRHP